MIEMATLFPNAYSVRLEGVEVPDEDRPAAAECGILLSFKDGAESNAGSSFEELAAAIGTGRDRRVRHYRQFWIEAATGRFRSMTPKPPPE